MPWRPQQVRLTHKLATFSGGSISLDSGPLRLFLGLVSRDPPQFQGTPKWCAPLFFWTRFWPVSQEHQACSTCSPARPVLRGLCCLVSKGKDTEAMKWFRFRFIYFCGASHKAEGSPQKLISQISRRLFFSQHSGDTRASYTYCGWGPKPFRATFQKPWNESSPLQIPTNNGFSWFQNGAGFRPSTVNCWLWFGRIQTPPLTVFQPQTTTRVKWTYKLSL